jgi:hypothetical protein
LKCETLPDPNEEREITAHITKWMEEKDTTVEKCIQNCQTGEEVCISVSITHFFRL